MHLAKIAILEICPPEQPTRAVLDEELDRELTASIQRVGVLVPIHVKQIQGGYEVIAGARRLRCAIEAGLAAVPCLVREQGDVTDLEIKVHENQNRQDLSPVEEAVFYDALYEANGKDVDRVCALLN